MTDRLPNDSKFPNELRPTEDGSDAQAGIDLPTTLLVGVVLVVIGIHIAGIVRDRAATALHQFSTAEKLQVFLDDELGSPDGAPGFRMLPLKCGSYSAWASHFDFSDYPSGHALAGEEVVTLRVLNVPIAPIRDASRFTTLIDLQRDGTVDFVLEGRVDTGGGLGFGVQIENHRTCTAAEQELYAKILSNPQLSPTINQAAFKDQAEAIRIL